MGVGPSCFRLENRSMRTVSDLSELPMRRPHTLLIDENVAAQNRGPINRDNRDQELASDIQVKVPLRSVFTINSITYVGCLGYILTTENQRVHKRLLIGTIIN